MTDKAYTHLLSYDYDKTTKVLSSDFDKLRWEKKPGKLPTLISVINDKTANVLVFRFFGSDKHKATYWATFDEDNTVRVTVEPYNSMKVEIKI